jgi:hypothetical protein
MSPHDDVHGVAVTMGLAIGRNNTAHLLSATPSVVAVLTSAVAGVIWYGRRRALRDVLTHDPQYPTPGVET